MTKRLYRSETNKIWAGICGGLGEYSNIDPVVVRLIFLFVILCTGFFPGIIAYFIATFIVPRNPSSPHLNHTHSDSHSE